MKEYPYFASLVIMVALEHSALGQGTFQNLDFEAAHNLPAPNGSVATTNALPGWTAFSGTNQLSTITYNSPGFFPEVGLYGPNFLEINGNFSALLRQAGSISQTGLVPADAQSLFFKGNWRSLSPSLGVVLGGQSLSYTAISSGPNYTLYGADISAFAGQTATLAFMAPSISLYLIDDIQFSPQAVPEPSALALLGLGSFFIAVHLLRRRR